MRDSFFLLTLLPFLLGNGAVQMPKPGSPSALPKPSKPPIPTATASRSCTEFGAKSPALFVPTITKKETSRAV